MPWEDFVRDAAPRAAEREFRLVTVSGTYDPAREVLWQARTLNGRSGHDVLTRLPSAASWCS